LTDHFSIAFSKASNHRALSLLPIALVLPTPSEFDTTDYKTRARHRARETTVTWHQAAVFSRPQTALLAGHHGSQKRLSGIRPDVREQMVRVPLPRW